MTKAVLIEQMANDAGISKAAAGKTLDSFVASVTKALKKKDGKITLVGFGAFSKVCRKARKGRNPQRRTANGPYSDFSLWLSQKSSSETLQKGQTL